MNQTVASTTPTTSLANGTKRVICGKLCVYYDGYWIKCYSPPADSLAAKKKLIEALTRRLFNHVEHGINIPGKRLNEARTAFERETDPARKRVNQAMLAGAYFNRAADIFTKLVELQELGVAIDQHNALMKECGQCLLNALDSGKAVRHRNGDESIDELWGEPFKAFSIPIEDFYQSRYIKIAQTMRNIDQIAETLVDALAVIPNLFEGIEIEIRSFAEAAKCKCETLRTDAELFDVWPSFVVAGERLSEYPTSVSQAESPAMRMALTKGRRLIEDGKALLTHIARARVTMPKSTAEFIARCNEFQQSYGPNPRCT